MQTYGLSIAARDEILAMAKDGATVTPEAVVERARDVRSALHGYFDWDDAAAAQKHRLDTARSVIRRVEIAVTVHDRTVRAPALVSVNPDTGGGYRSIMAVRDDNDAARAVVVSEVGRAISALKRAETVAGVLKLDGDVAELRTQVEKFQQRTRTAQAPPAMQ